MARIWLIRAGLVLVAGVMCVTIAQRLMARPGLPPMPKPLESGFAPVNRIRMYYAVYGRGTPILLIHGGLASADVWVNQIPPLVADGHEVIVADSRGQGRSTRTDEPIGYDLMTSDYLALLDYLKIDKVALVGWSDGGIIGLDIAMHHPERLTRLFAQGANASVDGLIPDQDNSKGLGAFMDWVGATYHRHFERSDSYDAQVEQMSEMWSSQPNWTADDLRTIQVPTEIVLGDHDGAVTLEHTEYLASTIPGARLLILPKVGHPAMLQDPEGYTKAVLAFVDGN